MGVQQGQFVEVRGERSEQEHGATEIYITGPSWPSAARVNVGDAPANPWSKQHWNLTRQGEIYRQNHAGANRLAQAAGHKDALIARRENAK